MTNKIQVEIFQHGDLLCCRVLEMPEELRGKGEIITNDKFRIESIYSPAINDTTLYLKGTDKSYDDTWFAKRFSSVQEAQIVKENCLELIEKYNSNQLQTQLKNIEPGKTVKLGNREYIVLGQYEDMTAVITKNFTRTMDFSRNNDYRFSNVRKYCNGEFYKELAEAVGEENIVKHKVNLTADDGTGKGVWCKDNVSILTTELYRRYREFLPAYGDWWWTATPTNSDNEDYARYVCCVRSDGILRWDYCDCGFGVRPYFILKNTVTVEK